VRYTVKPGQETVNEKLMPVVYDEPHQTSPPGRGTPRSGSTAAGSSPTSPSAKPSTGAIRCWR
jgi:hypothetical protein